MKFRITKILYSRPILLFLLFVLVAYLPVFLPFFHLKNDLVNQNLPTRFVFSESIYAGFEPFWNPYINFGIPQYGDMNSGFWNPFKWIIGITVGYNIYTITLEEMLYVLIGGFGIYKLSMEFFSKQTAIITALAYMACGYMTGHLQYFCWITGTAFFPYVLLFFTKVNKNPILRNFAGGAISVFFFISSTHPGLIIGALYFLLFLVLIIYFNRNTSLHFLYHRRFFLVNLLFILLSAITGIVVIVSNFEVLSAISRGTKVTLEQSLMAPTTLQSYLSLLYPLPVHKSGFFNTDIAMRNSYIGIAHLTGLFLLAKSNRRLIFSFAIVLLFFILLSAGGAFKAFSWKFIPLTGYVRLNGEFTYFVTLLLLLGGAAGIENYFKNEQYVKTLKSLLVISINIAIVSLLYLFMTKDSVLFSTAMDRSTFKTFVRSLLEESSFTDLLLLQAILQAITIWTLLAIKTSLASMLLILSANLVIITWLTLPFTGLGLQSKKEIHGITLGNQRGIPLQELKSINTTTYIDSSLRPQLLLTSSFDRMIGYTKPDQYPVELRSGIQLLNDSSLYSFIRQQAYLFLSTDTIGGSTTSYDSTIIRVLKAGPGYYSVTVNAIGYKWLTLLQNDYRHWKVFINKSPVQHTTGFKTFISVPLRPGEQLVEFRFQPSNIKVMMWISLITLVLCSMVCIGKTGSKKIFT